MFLDSLIIAFLILYFLFVVTFLSITTIGILWYLYQTRDIKNPKTITFKLVENNEYSLIPQKGTLHSAGFDLKSSENCTIPARTHKAIKTGIIVTLPSCSYGRIASRSGLSFKHGIEVGAGVIDEDYREEIMVILHNHSDNDFVVNKYDRIAQLIVESIITPNVLINDGIRIYDSNSPYIIEKRIGGFGSTGK